MLACRPAPILAPFSQGFSVNQKDVSPLLLVPQEFAIFRAARVQRSLLFARSTLGNQRAKARTAWPPLTLFYSTQLHTEIWPPRRNTPLPQCVRGGRVCVLSHVCVVFRLIRANQKGENYFPV